MGTQEVRPQSFQYTFIINFFIDMSLTSINLICKKVTTMGKTGVKDVHLSLTIMILPS